jgi:hypothetical protein
MQQSQATFQPGCGSSLALWQYNADTQTLWHAASRMVLSRSGSVVVLLTADACQQSSDGRCRMAWTAATLQGPRGFCIEVDDSLGNPLLVASTTCANSLTITPDPGG